MLSWWANVCWDAASQYGQDGSLLEIHVEKISRPSKTASVAALQCWRRKVLSLGKVSWLLSSTRGKAGEAQACCVHLCAYATHGSTSLHGARNVFLPFTLPTVTPAGSVLFTISALALADFAFRLLQEWLCFLAFTLPAPPGPFLAGWKQLRL